jgi:uncharacterized protein YndB with AHSA1/START domain
MAKTQTLTFKRTIKAPASDLYRAFTNSSALREWFSDAALSDARKGGRFYAWWNNDYYAAGEYLSVTPGKKLVLAWQGRGEPAATRVQASFAEKNGSTAVTVSHSGVGSGKPWAKAVKQITQGWERALENLQSAFETGEDQRISLRPMLGITLTDFNAEVASRLGVPVNDGIRLDGTLEGMGAHAAGLQKDDVIVGMAGKKVTGFPSLAAALQGRRAGERVEVKFYRDGKLCSASMELSKRPVPQTPATAAELAEQVRKQYAGLDAELEKCFAGVTEAEASFRPSQSEWSAKDVLCHLLAGERDGHAYIDESVLGNSRFYDGQGNNIESRHQALMKVHPTYRALLDEYKKAEAETVALLAATPPEVVARRGGWWQLCFGWLQPPIHNQAHFQQIRAAIEAARKR